MAGDASVIGVNSASSGCTCRAGRLSAIGATLGLPSDCVMRVCSAFQALGLGFRSFSAAVGVAFGLPSLRIKGFYLAIATLAAQFFLVWLFEKWAWLYNYSSSGAIQVPNIYMFGFPVAGPGAAPVTKYYFVLFVVAVITWLAINVTRGRIGRIWKSVRDMDIAAELVGIGLDRLPVDGARAILAAHAARADRRGVHRPERAEHLHLLVAHRRRAERGGRLHRDQREQLEHVVLHHVLQCANAVIIGHAAFEPDRLGHRDLHAAHERRAPQRLEDRIAEAQRHQVLHRLLAEIMVDAERSLLREGGGDGIVDLPAGG